MRVAERLLALCLVPLAAAGCAWSMQLGGGVSAAPETGPRTGAAIMANPGREAYGAGWTQTGVASWYGEPFHGRQAAAGEVYDMEALTAAHKTIPFGTRIRVDNLENGRSVEVTVNDRGPFFEDRILDLSRRAAREIDMYGSGTALVRITILEPGDAVSRRGGCVLVQVAAFRESDPADDQRDELRRGGWDAGVRRDDGWHYVVVGPYREEEPALQALDALGGLFRRC